jgi:hypothetical protein
MQLPPPPPHESLPGFAIVAPLAWKGALAPLAAARSKEFRVELVALEELTEGGPSGATDVAVDAPERIKRWLYRGWKERGLTHALLVGDADTFPVRFMVLDRCTEPAFDTAFYACDLYYADVANENGEFDDWNHDRDGIHARYFGEVFGEKHKDQPINHDQISYVPELAVGRWPVSDVATLKDVVAKTVAWKPTSEKPSALVVHSPGWIDARPRAAALVERLAKSGFEVRRQFFGDAGGVPTPATVSHAIGENVDLVCHLGHGSPDSWAGTFGGNEVAATANAHAAVYFSIGCNTAEFCTEAPYGPYLDESGLLHRGTVQGEVFRSLPPPPACMQPGHLNVTGIGERLIRMPQGGAIAYLGCNTGAQPCALTLLEGFDDALATHREFTVGEAWRAAIAHYHDAEHLADLKPTADWYPPSIFFQGMKFMLFGDPTLKLRAPAASESETKKAAQ